MTSRNADGWTLPRDGFRIALLLLLVVSVSRIHQHFDAVAALRPALALAGLTLLFGLGARRRLGVGELLERWPAKVMAALGVLACLSVPFALSMGASASFFLDRFSKILVLAFFLVAAMHDTRDVRLFVWGYVISAGILAWMAVFVFEVHPTLGQEGMRRLGDLYTYDANDLGCVLMVALPLTLLTFRTSGRWGKAISGLVLVGIGLSVARSGSRGAFVGLAAVMLALVLWVRHVALARRLGVLAVMALVVILASPQGYWDQMAGLTDLEDDYNVTSPVGRVALAKRGLGYMLDRPLTGLGVGNFPRAEGTISERARNFVPEPGENLRWMAPHNSYVQAGAEMGVPGLLLWSSLVLGGVVGLRRLSRRTPDAWRRGDDPERRFLHHALVYLPVALLGFAVTSSFVSFAYMDPAYVLAAFVCALHRCVDRARAADETAATSGRPPARPGPGVVAASAPPVLGRGPRRPRTAEPAG